MRKILVYTYVISPTRGSEFAVAWNYVTQMAETCEIVVLCCQSSFYMGDLEALKEYIDGPKKHPNITFLPFALTGWSLRLYNFCKPLVYHTPVRDLFYLLLNNAAYRVAREYMKTHPIDVVHRLSPIGYRTIGSLYKLPAPYIWGPLAGFNQTPTKFFHLFTLSGKIRFLVRNLSNVYYRYQPKLRKVLHNTDVVIACSTLNRDYIYQHYGVKAGYLPENGTLSIYNTPIKLGTHDVCHIISVGALVNGKAVRTQIEVLSKLRNRDKAQLHVVGDGPLRQELELLATRLGVREMVQFHGRIPRSEVLTLFQQMHLHILTSVSEGNSTVVLEAMEMGTPTISMDHCGMHDTITDDCGIKISIDQPYQDIVQDFANQIDAIIETPDRLNKLSVGTLKRARELGWPLMREAYMRFYEEAINSYNQKMKDAISLR